MKRLMSLLTGIFLIFVSSNELLAEKTFMKYPLSDAEIAKAIEQASKKNPKILHLSQLWLGDGYQLFVYTPTSWIMQKTYDKTSKYLPMSIDDSEVFRNCGHTKKHCIL